jgi:hypothetical protein
LADAAGFADALADAGAVGLADADAVADIEGAGTDGLGDAACVADAAGASTAKVPARTKAAGMATSLS